MKNVNLPKAMLALIISILTTVSANAQTNEFSGWGAWFHSQKLSKHWGLHIDAQFRSADKLAYLKNPLIRPGVHYYFANNKYATVGYLYTGTHRITPTQNTFRTEHRTWEQFIYMHKLSGNAVQHRFRLEQRYVGALGTSDPYFAQRFRYFIRGVIPTTKQTEFKKGTFVGLQNELFANIQNIEKTNNNVFDQNRAYVSFGYRFSKMIDLEAGYLNQYVKNLENDTFNHVAQIALYTRF
ncbi:DUF2490 domain-containing protein [Mucilaginibacter ginkgonis]|uniref:DUF2490 domain-containing protein n=1 Tax=Mucilaginibacter ginkgonis TaxID=2682091 RepID=A0A6I4HYT7_9SPHI|nr:DUF2490 domain-containing protein [Mucilaginibacter ginkgonis]QQL48597.1 DUF2490 domain-containing protein [Mucilaginibacter ginkgonis]